MFHEFELYILSKIMRVVSKTMRVALMLAVVVVLHIMIHLIFHYIKYDVAGISHSHHLCSNIRLLAHSGEIVY